MKHLLITAGLLLALVLGAVAQKASVFNKNGVAIGGYDVVAFFTDNKPVLGSASFAYQWQDVNWYFANQGHLDSFKLSPEKYAPQYGGYCAYGTAEGHKAPTEIDTWKIVDGRLFFNYNKGVQKLWLKDQEGFIKKADEQWPLIKDKE